MGNARLRQLRVQRNSCQIASSMLQFVPDCHAPYSWDVEDMGSYELGWNHSVRNISTSTSSPWKYQTQAQLRAYPIWGKRALYRGGGFVAELGPDLRNASRYVEHISKLEEHTVHSCQCDYKMCLLFLPGYRQRTVVIIT